MKLILRLGVLFSLFCGLVLFFAAASEEAKGSPLSEISIPEWAESAINETFFRFNRWRGDDETVVVPLITDLHSGRGKITFPIDWSDSKYHILLAERTAEIFGADCMADLGDIGFDRLPNWTPSDLQTANERLKAQAELYGAASVPVFFCIGNHDSGRAYGNVFSERKVSATEFGTLFNGMTRDKGVEFVSGPNLDYGYWDISGKKCRLVFLNTSDGGEIGYSDEQMSFLRDALAGADGKTVVILQHICLHPAIGAWYGSFPGGLFNNQASCIRMLKSYVRHEKGGPDTFAWDFTDTPNGSLAGVISGDSHFNAQVRQFGVNYIITQGYGTVQPENLPEECAYLPFNRSEQMLCDVAAVKPKKGEMMIFRVGAGGAEQDRVFYFEPAAE